MAKNQTVADIVKKKPRPVRRPIEVVEIPDRTWVVWGCSISLFLAMIRAMALMASQLDLLPDEAQYWSWSRDLAFGYFTKPPMVAWLIAATTRLAGDMEWGVRLAAPFVHAGTGIVMVFIARKLFNAKAAFWAALLYATLPGVSFSTLIISSDVPLLFFWALALLALVHLLDKPDWRWALTLGAAFGLGMLSKYAMAYFLLGMVVLAVLGPRQIWKPILPHLGLAVVVALAILAPNLIWNANHGWATVGHTAANADLGGVGGIHLIELLSFAGAQFGVFGPVLLVVLILRVVFWRRDPPPRAERLLVAFAVPVLVLMIVQSGISRAHANWAAVSYIAGTLLAVGWLDRIKRTGALAASLALHTIVFAAFTLLFAGAVHATPPKWADIFNQMRGWRTLGDLAWRKIGTLPPGTTLAAEDRQVMAELDYYTRGRFFPLAMAVGTGKPGNQYELESAIDAKTGAQVMLVSRFKDRTDILDRFEKQSIIEEWTVRAGEGRQRHYYVYDLSGFKSG